MKETLIPVFRSAFPFLAVLFLWRLSMPFWNPAGILALIPIFYCTFVKPVNWFVLYGIIFSFLIDYKLNTVVLWTVLYCICYAANGLQNYIDLTRSEKNAYYVFLSFIGFGMVCILFSGFNFMNLVRTIWLFAWTAVLYIPITELIKRVRHD